jgi:hypothetical protein
MHPTPSTQPLKRRVSRRRTRRPPRGHHRSPRRAGGRHLGCSSRPRWRCVSRSPFVLHTSSLAPLLHLSLSSLMEAHVMICCDCSLSIRTERCPSRPSARPPWGIGSSQYAPCLCTWCAQCRVPQTSWLETPSITMASRPCSKSLAVGCWILVIGPPNVSVAIKVESIPLIEVAGSNALVQRVGEGAAAGGTQGAGRGEGTSEHGGLGRAALYEGRRAFARNGVSGTGQNGECGGKGGEGWTGTARTGRAPEPDALTTNP